MNVEGILKGKGSNVLGLNENDTIESAVTILAEKKIGATVVLDNAGKLVGILSERDIVREIGNQGASVLNKSIGDIMTKDVQTCSPSDAVAKIMAQMTEGRFRHLPVMDNGNMVGIISIGDVVKNRINELEFEANAMRDYITTG
ncbi:CBS domain-containing protein [Curvivirga sp.]|uniref:CBS domain-containing protein n=1 Tax=Curvivirga sp. TaxID=2856848 RepID=UPI003B599CFE